MLHTWLDPLRAPKLAIFLKKWKKWSQFSKKFSWWKIVKKNFFYGLVLFKYVQTCAERRNSILFSISSSLSIFLFVNTSLFSTFLSLEGLKFFCTNMHNMATISMNRSWYVDYANMRSYGRPGPSKTIFFMPKLKGWWLSILRFLRFSTLWRRWSLKS